MKTSPNPSVDVLRQFFVYDEHTGKLSWRISPAPNVKVGTEAGTLDKHGYIKVAINGLYRFAHRIAWAIHHGEHTSMLLDHINGIRTDNRICNLRECGNMQNQMNRRRKSTSSCQYKGIARLKNGRFMAQIKAYGKHQYLGTYATDLEAALVYDEAARKAFGEFASVNFPANHQQRQDGGEGM